jgi:hypothetical protein
MNRDVAVLLTVSAVVLTVIHYLPLILLTVSVCYGIHFLSKEAR